MKPVRSYIAILLLAGVCCVTLLGVPAQATAAAPFGCSQIGCSGGPDNCMAVEISIKGVSIAVTCFMRAPAGPIL